MNFSKNLLDIRKMKGLSQTELSKLCSIPQTTISDWERGKSMPGIAQVVVLSKKLNIPISDFVKEDKNWNYKSLIVFSKVLTLFIKESLLW